MIASQNGGNTLLVNFKCQAVGPSGPLPTINVDHFLTPDQYQVIQQVLLGTLSAAQDQAQWNRLQQTLQSAIQPGGYRQQGAL